MKRENFMLTVLETVSPDNTSDLWWRCDKGYAPITFMINCNDVFAWGCSDCVEITEDNLLMLIQAYQDTSRRGAELFCARVRKMRPQGAWYAYCPEAEWPLFDACGPVREVDIGNPYAQGTYKPMRATQGEPS